MSVDFACKDCGQGYRAPRAMAGRLFACRKCGWPTHVPGRQSHRPMPEAMARGGDRAARPKPVPA